MKIFRILAGILTGIIVAVVVLFMLESFVPKIFNLSVPKETTPEVLNIYIKNFPQEALIFMLFNYFIASVAGGFTAMAIAMQKQLWIFTALVIGCILTLAGYINITNYPTYPNWFTKAILMVYVPGALLGGFLAKRIMLEYEETLEEITTE